MVAGTALLRGEEPYLRGATSELQISFLAGARVGPVLATARVLRRGQRSAVVRVEVCDAGADDLHVATATLTFAVTGMAERSHRRDQGQNPDQSEDGG
jgi:acyl-coenzyme A thioesterase PaaI-like protein